MALLQKNPYSSENSKPLYTLGMNRSVLIVGLGNVGKKYETTRHNAGFICLDEFAKAHNFDPWIDKKDLRCRLAIKTLGDVRAILVKPTTMMNLSGEAVQAVAHFYKIELGQIVVVHDELDIPFGQIRMRIGGSAAGHNGIKSLIQHLGDEFGRVRVGIQPDSNIPMDTSDYVLTTFSKDEKTHLPAMSREVTSILTEYVYRSELQPETRNFMI